MEEILSEFVALVLLIAGGVAAYLITTKKGPKP